MKKARFALCTLLVILLMFPMGLAYAEETTPNPPAVEPADPPAQPPAEPPEAKSAEVVIVGDLMALSAQISGARKGKGYDFRYAFARVKPIISGADLAIGNLETPIAGGKYPYTSGRYKNGYPVLNAPEAYAAAVKDAGFDIVATANNHSLDCGEKGLINTLEILKKYKLATAGTYRTKSDRAVPLVAEANGIKVAVLSYTVCTNKGERKLSKSKRAYMYNQITSGTVSRIAERDIKAAKEKGAEVVIVMVHWGRENTHSVNSSQKSMAKKIAAAGADIIIGSHPHVLQGTTRITSNTPYGKKTCFVAYSLGNFISSMGRTANKDTVLLKFTIHKSAEGAISIEKPRATAAYTFSSYGGKRFVVVPYSASVKVSSGTLKSLKSAYSRVARILNTKYVKMVR